MAVRRPKGLFRKGNLGVCSPPFPKKVAKLKHFCSVFHGFSTKDLIYRLDLNDNASFTLSKPKID